MTDATAPETLLEHAPALRALARALVRDIHEAEDLVQATWLRALQQRPAAEGGLRAWLTRVLRNEARMRQRGDRRAAARERRVASPEPLPPTSDVVARLEVQREVLDAVQALTPACRDVVYLRWFEDLPPRRIAARLGIPRRAVESRLRRALEQLRERLDREQGRSKWVGALAGFAWPGGWSWIPVIAGAVAVKTKMLLGALLLSLGVVIFFVSRDTAQSVPPSDPAAGAPASLLTAEAPEPVGEAVDASVVPRSELPEPGDAEEQPAPEWMRGIVVDEYEDPVGGVGVRFEPDSYWTEQGHRPVDAAADSSGLFTLEYPEAAGLLVCTAPGFTTVLAAQRPYPAATEVVVVVAADRTISGVVQRRDGAAIAHAKVELELPEGFRSRFDRSLRTSQVQKWRVTTDANGRFALPSPPDLAGCRLSVVAQNHAPLAVDLEPGDHPDLRLVMHPLVSAAGEVRGVVLDAQGMPVAGARVALGWKTQRTREDGRFHFVVLDAASQTRLFAVAEGWRPAVAELEQQPGGQWPEEVELRLLDRPLKIEGTVLRADGEPHARAWVWVADPTYFAVEGDFAYTAEHTMHRDELLWHRFATDEHGRFAVLGLDDREYALRAVDQETTEMAALEGVRGGSSGIVLRFSPEMLHERVEGRVVDHRGEPVGGVYMTVSRRAFIYGAGQSDHSYISQARGARGSSDRDGQFVLHRVPRTGVMLELGGENLATSTFEWPDGVVTTPVEIVVARGCGLRIDVSGSDLVDADEASLEDAAGTSLLIKRVSSEVTYVERRTALTGGRTEVLTVPDNAAMVVFLRQGVEIGRLPVRVGEQEVAVLRR